MARVLYITTSQPGCNPRLRKSADAMSGAGHQVHVLYLYKSEWATEADAEIFEAAGWTHQLVGGSPTQHRWRYFLSRLVRKAAEMLSHRKRAFCRGYSEFLRHGAAFKPTLIVGHNPGALGPIVTLGDRLGVPVVFDAEDYHRGEFPEHSKEAKETALLEEELLPKVTAMTAASPLIARMYAELFPEKQIDVIWNVFSLKYLKQDSIAVPEDFQPLKMIWFSQVIGPDRGLLEFFQAFKFLKDIPLEVCLIGACRPGMEDMLTELLSENHQLSIRPPMPESKLFAQLANHEIGLGLETGFSTNNEIALSNKALSYPLAGCLSLLSKTQGQSQFIQTNPAAGTLIDLNDPQKVAQVIRWTKENRRALTQQRIKALALAKGKLNWELESLRLQECLGALINS